jgi:predicted XRE-type DNA-binding protein
MANRKMANKHLGSSFDAYLAEEGILEECEANALKKVLAMQIDQAMKKQGLTKSAMARRMKTSRPALDRLLDSKNTSVTLNTLQRAAAAVGKKIQLSLTNSK